MDLVTQARSFLAGESLTFKEADQLWQGLGKEDKLPLARAVLSRLRQGKYLTDALPAEKKALDELCRQEALFTSKDPELSSATRHRLALEILASRFVLQDPALDGDEETLGIAGGIHKRQWLDLGQYEDLRSSARYYGRGIPTGEMSEDAYAAINAAFLEELLASRGDDGIERRKRANEIRDKIVAHIPEATTKWWPAASRAEALLGLRKYKDAADTIARAERPAMWKLQTTTRQLAALAHLLEPDPLKVPEIRDLFNTLLPGAADAVASSFIGKVGLALSGGGFRASFYHLGVLACLAELDVLRHVEVLSCVSGGSIVGACYWLFLRERLLKDPPMKREDYVSLVARLIEHFENAVAVDVRRQIQPSTAALAFQFLVRKRKGAMDPDETAKTLDEHFYRPVFTPLRSEPVRMHELIFTPNDHDAGLTGSKTFHPDRHNWLRANKVPGLVLNATTVNTGRGWQFTPTWMGESPWALNEGADNIERLQWAWYEPDAGWQIQLARAVAASASVPGIFAPLNLGQCYQDVEIQLVDGGVYDNQGVSALLAANCNVLLVSDAAGQLLLERRSDATLKALGSYAMRAMDILMERVRQATYADLNARQSSGLIRGLMFLHMKAGLDADTIRLPFSQETFQVERAPLTPSGIRKEFQKALAELRTDLDAFTTAESSALMACGYQMASEAFKKQLASKTPELVRQRVPATWTFESTRQEITSTAATTPDRGKLLHALNAGSKVIL
ncbi:MAG: patatin-like phospholipase family protein [Candidatus Solibacter sp.]